MDTISESADWSLLQTFLPAGWEEQARLSGAFERARRIGSPADLLRLLLVLCGVGLSYQRTTEVASLGGVGEVSKVSLWHRAQRCGAWLEWLTAGLLGRVVERPPAGFYRPRAVDGSVVAGPLGTVQVRLHFALDLLSLRPAQVLVTDLKQAEGLRCLTVAPRDLWVGDRGFATVKNVAWAKAGDGEVLVRLGRRTLRLYDSAGRLLDPLVLGRSLEGFTPGWCEAWCETPSGGRTAGRLVVVRLSPAAAARSQAKLRRTGQRKQRTMAPETVEMAGYLCLFTTAPAEHLSVAEALAWFGARWQVELAFKRLKSLLKASELRARSTARARVWLLGKMVYALLLHACLDEAGAFSPWGYPVPGSAARLAGELHSGVGLDGVDEPGVGGGLAGVDARPLAELVG